MSMFQSEITPPKIDLDLSSPSNAKASIERALSVAINAAVEANTRTEKGSLTAAEQAARLDKIADDLRAVQVASASINAEASHSRSLGESEGVLRSFVASDGRVNLTTHNDMIFGQSFERRGLLDVDEDLTDWHRKAKELAFSVKVAAACKSRHQGRATGISLEHAARHAPRATAEFMRHLGNAPAELGELGKIARSVRSVSDLERIQKVFTSGTDSLGGYAIPDEVLSGVIEADVKYGPGIRLSSDVLGVEQMTGNRFDQVFLTGNSRPYIYGAATSDEPSKFTTSNLQMSKNTTEPISLAIRYVGDINSIEDSILTSIAQLGPYIVRDMALMFEDVFHNGDTNATHQDAIATWNPNSMWGTTSGAGSTADHRRAFRGIRARALDASATVDMNGSLTRAYLTGNLPAAMGVGHSDANRRVLNCSTNLWLKQITKLEQVSTVDKFGSNATVLGIRLGAIDGLVLETSPFIADTMNASGVYDGVTTTKGVISVYNPDRFRKMIRRGVAMSVVTDPERGTVSIVCTVRLNMRDIDNGAAGTSVKNCALLYNVTA